MGAISPKDTNKEVIKETGAILATLAAQSEREELFKLRIADATSRVQADFHIAGFGYKKCANIVDSTEELHSPL